MRLSCLCWNRMGAHPPIRYITLPRFSGIRDYRRPSPVVTTMTAARYAQWFRSSTSIRKCRGGRSPSAPGELPAPRGPTIHRPSQGSLLFSRQPGSYLAFLAAFLRRMPDRPLRCKRVGMPLRMRQVRPADHDYFNKKSHFCSTIRDRGFG